MTHFNLGKCQLLDASPLAKLVSFVHPVSHKFSWDALARPTLIEGDASTGKTSLFKEIISQACLCEGIEEKTIVVIDPKGDPFLRQFCIEAGKLNKSAKTYIFDPDYPDSCLFRLSDGSVVGFKNGLLCTMKADAAQTAAVDLQAAINDGSILYVNPDCIVRRNMECIIADRILDELVIARGHRLKDLTPTESRRSILVFVDELFSVIWCWNSIQSLFRNGREAGISVVCASSATILQRRPMLPTAPISQCFENFIFFRTRDSSTIFHVHELFSYDYPEKLREFQFAAWIEEKRYLGKINPFLQWPGVKPWVSGF